MKRFNFNSKTMYLLFDRNSNFTELQLHFSKQEALQHKKNRLAKIKNSHQKELVEIYRLHIKDAELLTD